MPLSPVKGAWYCPKNRQMTKTRKINPPWAEIFASLGDGLVILESTPERRIIGMNPAAELTTGFSAETTLGVPLAEAFSENVDVLRQIDTAFASGGAITLREMPWKGRNRQHATVDLSATPLIGDEGELSGWILVFRDVTPLKNLEEEIRKADRLAMMGTIAAGLAHEIKNPLGGIKGAAQLLGREKLSPESTEYVRIIVRESERVDRLVGRLLALTRPRKLAFVPVNINEILDSILILEGEEGFAKKKKVRIVREFDPSLPSVLGDEDELRQAFLNFIKNALEAVEERPAGKGEIRVKSRILTDFRIKAADGSRVTRMIMIEIQDNGEGIDAGDLQKVFTPFFTTKGSGTGLGLAIAQRAINEHGGAVQILSEKGKGTKVQVSLRGEL